MRLGVSYTFPHSTPEEWAEQNRAHGLRAVVFPLDYTAPDADIDAYVKAAREYDLLIAEVGAWSNPMSPDPGIRDAAIDRCKRQLALAEYVGARCCCNISGAVGSLWDGGYPENYAPDTFDRIVETTREILDAVHPVRTRYTLEPMPQMLPDSPESCLRLLEAVDRPGLGAHLDVVNMINCPERYFFNRDFLRKCFSLLKGRIRSCHAKDIRMEPKLTLCMPEVPLGEGALDIPLYARLATREDPDMPFIIEHLPDQAAYLRAIEYVRRTCRERDD